MQGTPSANKATPTDVLGDVVLQKEDIFKSIYAQIGKLVKVPTSLSELKASLKMYTGLQAAENTRSRNNGQDARNLTPAEREVQTFLKSVEIVRADMALLDVSFKKAKHVFIEGEDDYV